MPRKKKDPNAPKVPAKPRAPKVVAMPSAVADLAVGDTVTIEGFKVAGVLAEHSVAAVEQNAVGTLVELKPAPPAAAPPFGIGARRG